MEKTKKKIGIKTKIIIILCSIIALCFVFVIIRILTVDANIADEDRINNNVNVLLTRSDNWYNITDKQIIPSDEMALIDGSTATIPITAEIARQFFDVSDENIENYLNHNTTHLAYVNLIDRQTNETFKYDNEYKTFSKEVVSLIFVTPPSDEELAYAKEKEVELDIQPVAMDGFVFITHKDNPVDSLTVQQIQDIYSGKITNWKQVGGNNEKIVAYQREANSGSQTAMENLVMSGKTLIEPKNGYITEGMGQLIEVVAEYENDACSIGYTYYYYMNNLYKNDNIKVIKVNDITPENENLLSGEYPFTTSYYAVIRADELTDSSARKLRDYMLSDEGQEIVKLAGYCPVVED